MKAVLKGRVIAESDDIVEHGGYHYFPNAHVRVESAGEGGEDGVRSANARTASSSTMW